MTMKALVGFQEVKPQKVLLSNVFKAIKSVAMALKKLYLWLKKLCHFITNLFFLANTPTLGRVNNHGEKNLTPSRLLSWSPGVTERYLPLPCYNRTEIHAKKARENKSAVSRFY